VNRRSVGIALLALWLAFAPLAGAWAQWTDTPCESMTMSGPADDCCGEAVNAAKCLSACFAVSAVMVAPAVAAAAGEVAGALVMSASAGHTAVPIPPDPAPPKASVS